MTRETAWTWLTEWTRSESLLRHALSLELVMRALARRFAENEDLWGIAGLLHDADYEAFPERHPELTVTRLREAGEEELAHAVSAHFTRWGIPPRTLMAKALLASDELTGFVWAASLVHPEGIAGLTVPSVLKKLKKKDFAAKVDREEIRQGAETLGVEPADLAGEIITVLRAHKGELGLR